MLTMKLSAPKSTSWVLAVIAGGLGILGHYMQIPFATAYSWILLVVGFGLLFLGTTFKGI